MQYPDNLRYTIDHEWIRVDGAFAYIGITDFAQSELGDIVYVEVDTLGDNVTEGAIFGTIEAVKTTSDLFMPVSSKVVEFNPALDEKQGNNPTLVNTDPYGDGWIVKVELNNPADIENLMTAADYSASLS